MSPLGSLHGERGQAQQSRSFLDLAQVHEPPSLLSYFFLPVLEGKAQLHLLSRKGNGFPLVVAPCARWAAWQKGCEATAVTER